MPPVADPTLDASPAYHLWDDLFAAGLRLALSTSCDSPEEAKAARERLIRGQQRSLGERNAMLKRIVAYLRDSQHGG